MSSRSMRGVAAAILLGLTATAIATVARTEANADAAGATAGATFSASEDFNGTAVGALPAGWSPDTSGGAVGVAAVPDLVNRSLRTAKTTATGSATATETFGPLTGVVQVEARVRVEQTTGWFNALYIAGSDWTAAASIAVRNGQFNNVATGQNLLAVVAGRWYLLRAVLHTDTHVFDLFIDGQKVLASAAFRQASSDIARITVGIGNGYLGTLYVDTVTARREADPSVNYAVLDQFNDTPIGSRPPGYLVTAARGNTVSTVATPSDEDRSLLLTKTQSIGSTSAVRAFTAKTGRVTVQANVRTDETAGVKVALYAQSSAGRTAAAIQFNNGWLIYFDGTAGHPLLPVTAGEWYTLRLVLDVAAQQFEIFVDGRRFAPSTPAEQVAPRWVFRDRSATDIGQVTFSVGDGQVGTVRADNVIAFGNPLASPPGPVLDVRQAPYLAVGDGLTDNTAAIQRAINDVPPGGSVVLANGVFRTGTIRLKSNMTLWVNQDAVLLGTWDEAGYPLFDAASTGTPSIGGQIRRALILSVGASNLSIDGGGTIDGNGDNPRWIDSFPDPVTLRPVLMFLTKGQHVSVRNIQVKDSAAWGIVAAEDDGLLIADVNVDSNIFGGRDGIDIVDSHDSLVERVSVWSDDDAICFKSHTTKGVDDATVRLSTVGRSERANGVKFGTASFGSFRNVVVEDVLVKHVNKAALTVAAVDGSAVGNVTYRRITIDHALRAFFVLLGKRTEATSLPSWVSGLRYQGIVATGLIEPSVIAGQLLGVTTYRVYDVVISNVQLTVGGIVGSRPTEPAEYSGIYPESNYWSGNSKLPAHGMFFWHVDGLTIRNSTATVPQADQWPLTAFRDTLNSN